MKYVLFFLGFLLCNANLKAQEVLDVITLKDGTIYKGTLAEYSPGGKTVMVLTDGRTKEFNSKAIQTLHESKNRAFTVEEKGFNHSSSIGFLLGNSGYDNEINFQYTMVNGYKIQRWGLGLGTGVEMLKHNLTTPLFLNLSYDFKPTRTTPYIAGQLGRSINLGFDAESGNNFNNSQFKNGYLAGLSLGIKHRFTSELGLLLSAGYRYYDLSGSYEERDWDGESWLTYDVGTRLFLNRFNLTIGLTFN
ncbi:MAG: outer membrane protein [Flavobacteriales bacterium]